MTGTAAVYRGLSQEELDREYSPSSLVPSLDACLDEWAQLSALARARHRVIRDLRYGPSEEEVLDFFPARAPCAPLVVFIHGGYWCALSKEESSFLAPGLLAQGTAFAALGYPLAPRASLDEIVAACARALVWLRRSAPELGVDPARIQVSGMSAGAHLAAMLATGEHSNSIRGVIAMSGVYDLEPITRSYVNEPLALDAAAVRRNSPLHQVRGGLPPLVVAYGENETAEFKRQGDDFADAWASAANTCVAMEVPGRHHFDVVYECAEPETALGASVAAQIAGPNVNP